MQSTTFFRDLSEAFEGTSQHVADELANETRNGCFEHCDGYPEALTAEQGAILLGAADAVENGQKAADTDELLARARRLAEVSGAVQRTCKLECPGAYSLFGEDDELYTTEGKGKRKKITPIKVTCPIKDKLTETVVELGFNSNTSA